MFDRKTANEALQGFRVLIREDNGEWTYTDRIFYNLPAAESYARRKWGARTWKVIPCGTR